MGQITSLNLGSLGSAGTSQGIIGYGMTQAKVAQAYVQFISGVSNNYISGKPAEQPKDKKLLLLCKN